MNDNGNYTVEDVKLSEGEISWNTWIDTYKPIVNHLDKGGDPSMEEYLTFSSFETYGEEWEYVKQQDPHYVWTEVQGDFSSLLVPGIAFVNRLQYYVCKEPWTDEDLTVLISVEVECECYDEDRIENGGEYGDPACELCEGYGYRTEYVD